MESNFDGDGAMKMMLDAAIEQFASAVADEAIEQGVKSVEEARTIELDLDADSPEIDIEKVKVRAREILIARLS